MIPFLTAVTQLIVAIINLYIIVENRRKEKRPNRKRSRRK